MLESASDTHCPALFSLCDIIYVLYNVDLIQFWSCTILVPLIYTQWRRDFYEAHTVVVGILHESRIVESHHYASAIEKAALFSLEPIEPSFSRSI